MPSKAKTTLADGSTAAQRGARRRGRTRAKALDAAEGLLAERATDTIRIEDVAEEAGISPASVYTHFGTKDALFAEVTSRLLDTAAARLAEAYASAGTPFERIEAAGMAYIRLLLEHPVIVRHFVGDPPGALGVPTSNRPAERIETVRAGFEAVIQAAVDSGELRPLDARLMSYFLFGAWNGVAALSLADAGGRLSPREVERAIEQAMALLAEGAAAPGAGS